MGSGGRTLDSTRHQLLQTKTKTLRRRRLVSSSLGIFELPVMPALQMRRIRVSTHLPTVHSPSTPIPSHQHTMVSIQVCSLLMQAPPAMIFLPLSSTWTLMTILAHIRHCRCPQHLAVHILRQCPRHLTQTTHSRLRRPQIFLWWAWTCLGCLAVVVVEICHPSPLPHFLVIRILHVAKRGLLFHSLSVVARHASFLPPW